MKNKILEFMFPARCAICAEPPKLVCDQCFPLINPSRFQFESVPGASSFDYGIELGKLIAGFKDRSLTQLAEPLAKAWLAGLEWSITEFRPTIIMLPPSSRANSQKRGYNPCELLARRTLKSSKLEIATLPVSLLALTRQTKDQTSLNQLERAVNLTGALKYLGVPDSKVLLVDDVMTTGSTMREMLRAVKLGGAQVVGICVLAKRT